MFLILLLVLVVGAAFAIPYFFKEELVGLAKTQINQQIDAEVDFDEDIKLSLFKHFPDLSLQINDISVTGNDAFDGYQLAQLGSASFDLDIMSVIKKDLPIRINSIRLQDAEVKVLVLEDGTANYDIATASADTSSASADFNIALEAYELSNVNMLYQDKQSGTRLEILGLDHSGSGDFTATEYDLSTQTDMESLTFGDGTMTYLVDATTAATIIINIDNSASKYTFKNNNVKVNDLELELDGWLQQSGSAYDMELTFQAPGTAFKSLWSLIPYAYTKDYRDVKADGIMALSGSVNGRYNQNTLPAFQAALSVSNGSIQYPDLPLGIADVQAKVDINSPSSNLDDMTVKIPQFHMDLGGNPIDATLVLKRPMSDPDIQTSIEGHIDLNKLVQAFPIENVETLNGQIDANLEIDTRMSYIELEAYDKVNMNGTLKVANMNIQSGNYPAIQIQQLDTDFAPQFVDLKAFSATLGKSDIRAFGRLDNLLAYFSPDLTMKGDLNLRGSLFDANEWLPESTEETPTAEASAPSEAGFDRFDFSLDAKMDKIVYQDYVLESTIAKGSFSPSRVQLENFETKIEDSDLKVSGRLGNVYAYLF
ncbi:MAG: AsmA family protein, partial [Bacteroidota bacterium]